MRTGRFSLRNVLVISRFNRSEMNGVLRYWRLYELRCKADVM